MFQYFISTSEALDEPTENQKDEINRRGITEQKQQKTFNLKLFMHAHKLRLISEAIQ